jgi:hypothetical protein
LLVTDFPALTRQLIAASNGTSGAWLFINPNDDVDRK